jgi:CRISPR-associated protein Csa2
MLSIAFRAILNLESLNGVESVGNLSRHRTAPIVTPDKNGGYVTKYVPVLSGESLGHGYQVALVDVANNMKLPVGTLSKRGEFIKYTESGYLKEDDITAPKSIEDCRRFETDVLLKDITADIGGFFYAANPSVKRTSRVQFGYMLPAADSIESASMDTQFHARHIPSETEGTDLGQMPYNVEVGSALYTTTINLDIERISELSVQYGKSIRDTEKELSDQKIKRKKAALSALMQLLSSLAFGARKSRFFPNIEFISAIAAISKPYTFIVSSGSSKDYINTTKSRAQNFKSFITNIGSAKEMMIDLVAFDKNVEIVDDGIEKADSIEDLMVKVLSKIQNRFNLVS